MTKIEKTQRSTRSQAASATKAQPRKPRRKSSATKSSKSITIKSLLIRLGINGVIILILGIGAAVATHYLLQSGTRHGAHCTVPELSALTIAEAERVVEQYDLTMIINDSLYAPTVERGTILDQIPEEGTVVKPGRTIYVTINATQQKMVDVPFVAGRSLRQAKNMLEVAGLTINRLNYEPDIATNYILSQSYDGSEVTEQSNLRAPVGAGVTLTVGVGEGQDQTVMPQLIGCSLSVAQSALWSAGLNVSKVTYDEGIDESNSKLAVVVEQSFAADSLITLGRDISFKVSLDGDLVEQYFKQQREELKMRAEMEAMEKALADSLALIAPDTLESAPAKVRAERVDFEDLFN